MSVSRPKLTFLNASIPLQGAWPSALQLRTVRQDTRLWDTSASANPGYAELRNNSLSLLQRPTMARTPPRYYQNSL